MYMPIGKHKGKNVEDIPSSYLYWFLNNVEEEHSPLYKAIDNEYMIRENTNSHFEED